MSNGARVFAGVLIRRRIAAQRNAALLTGAEMHPGGADFHTLSALLDFRLFDRFDRIEVRAGAIIHLRLLLFEAVNRR